MSSKIFVRIHPVLMKLLAKISKSPMGPWAPLPIGPMAYRPHCPCAPLAMWPIAHVAHTPCTPYPLCRYCPCSPYPVPHTPCGPHWPCAPYPLYPFAPCLHIAHRPRCLCGPYPLYPIAPLAIWPITQWGAGVMGNGAIVYRGYGVQGV